MARNRNNGLKKFFSILLILTIAASISVVITKFVLLNLGDIAATIVVLLIFMTIYYLLFFSKKARYLLKARRR